MSTPSIGPRPNTAANLVDDFENDLKYGTNSTMLGRVLHKAGVQGLYHGVSPQTAEFLGSPALGATRVAHAATIANKHPIRALNEAAQGVGQMSALPMGAMSPAFLPNMTVGSFAPIALSTVLKKAGMQPRHAEALTTVLMMAPTALRGVMPSAKRAVPQTTEEWNKFLGENWEGKVGHGTRSSSPKTIRNASAPGPSGAASYEAMSRLASERSRGIQRFRVDTRSGRRIPLIGPDAVDARINNPYEKIVKVGPHGEEVVDRGHLSR